MFICRLCGNDRHTIFLPEITSVFNESFKLLQCRECSFVSIEPIPTRESLDKYYNEDYWSPTQKKTNRLFNLLFVLRMSGVVREVRKIVPLKGRILDWGAGDGALQKLFNNSGFECWGIDRYSRQTDNMKLVDSTIEEVKFPDNHFDAITCFHVLEHIHTPLGSTIKAFALLKKGGLFILEVPNIDSYGFKFFKHKWQPLEIPTHLNHFSIKSLTELFSKIEDAEIEKVSYYSNRVSQSSIILSLFPFLKPRRLRNKKKNILVYMLLYLFLQVLVLPLSIFCAFLERGEVIRLYIRKKNE